MTLRRTNDFVDLKLALSSNQFLPTTVVQNAPKQPL